MRAGLRRRRRPRRWPHGSRARAAWHRSAARSDTRARDRVRRPRREEPSRLPYTSCSRSHRRARRSARAARDTAPTSTRFAPAFPPRGSVRVTESCSLPAHRDRRAPPAAARPRARAGSDPIDPPSSCADDTVAPRAGVHRSPAGSRGVGARARDLARGGRAVSRERRHRSARRLVHLDARVRLPARSAPRPRPARRPLLLAGRSAALARGADRRLRVVDHDEPAPPQRVAPCSRGTSSGCGGSSRAAPTTSRCAAPPPTIARARAPASTPRSSACRAATRSTATGRLDHLRDLAPRHARPPVEVDARRHERPARRAERLTPRGIDFVRELDAHRVFVDLAHINRRGFFDAVAAHDRSLPLIVSHTGVDGRDAALAQHRRRAAPRGRGHRRRRRRDVPVAASSAIRCSAAAPRRSIAHLEHIDRRSSARTTPRSAATGTATIIPPRDMPTCLELPRLVELMLARRWSPERIRKVLGGNFLRALAAIRP